MAYDFPTSPSVGAVYGPYTWDGEKWYSTLGGTSAAAPSPPTILTGLIGWWDAKVSASLTLSGSDLLAWADQSGAGNTMSWTANGKPQYSATGFNTHPAVFTRAVTGTPSFCSLQNTSFPMGTGNTLTFWYVGYFNFGISSGSARAISYMGAGAADDNNDVRSWTTRSNTANSNQQTIGRDEDGGVSPVWATCANTTNHRVIGTINSSGVQTMYVDGVATTLATVPGNWTSPGTLSLGRNAASVANFWEGTWGEFGVATGFTNSTNVAALDLYLRNKWSIPGYSDACSTGNRTGLITISTTLSISAGTTNDLIDGLFADVMWIAGSQTGKTLTFDFGVGASKVISEFKWYQSSGVSQGTWVLGGSNDNSSYTEFPESFSLGATTPQTNVVTNATGYRYYRLRSTAGTTSSGPYLHEIEFKIA